MRTTDPARKEDVHDPIGKLGWPKEKGRDGERTPMQWNAGKHAGFTTGAKPWLPIPPSAVKYNVEVEKADQDSILNTYKRLLLLRKEEPALRDGAYESVGDDEHVFAYLRKSGDSTVLVALNMSGQARTVDLKSVGANADVLYRMPLGKGGTAHEVLSLGKVDLEPYGVVVAKVK